MRIFRIVRSRWGGDVGRRRGRRCSPTTGGGMIVVAARATSVVYITNGKSEDEGQIRKRGYKQ